jgi:tRNA (guanine37-N1)-methyltransferase
MIDLRDFTRDRHRTADDRPFGGGPGMVLRPEPIVEAVEWLERRHRTLPQVRPVSLGRRVRPALAAELALEERVLLLAGRYEGFDERVRRLVDFETCRWATSSLGRRAPGAVRRRGRRAPDPGRARQRGVGAPGLVPAGGLLDYPQYTRPRTFRGLDVPEVLCPATTERIERWRRATAENRTRVRRPDLIPESPHTQSERPRSEP